MALTISFTKKKQAGNDPDIIMIEHAGETIFIKPFSVREGLIRVSFEGPKSFFIKRLGYEKKNINED